MTRLIDLTVASLALLVSSPVLLVAMIAIRGLPTAAAAATANWTASASRYRSRTLVASAIACRNGVT